MRVCKKYCGIGGRAPSVRASRNVPASAAPAAAATAFAETPAMTFSDACWGAPFASVVK